MLDLTKFQKVNILDDNGDFKFTAYGIAIENGKMILKGLNFPLLPHKQSIEAIAFMDDGIVPFVATVTLSTDKQLNLDIESASKKEDRRDALKVRVNSVEAVLAVRSTGKAHRPVIRCEDEIKLQNISMGGVGFLANRPYFKHQRLEINLSEIKKDLVVNAIVLRKTRLHEAGGYKYSYGCKFSALNQEQERLICEFVFKIEMESRKNREN